MLEEIPKYYNFRDWSEIYEISYNLIVEVLELLFLENTRVL